jgi:hypothetical protein
VVKIRQGKIMSMQDLNSAASTYGAPSALPVQRQVAAAPTANRADKATGSFADYYTRSLQQKAQEEKSAAKTAAMHQSLATELSDYLKKSPAQHLREAVMKEMGITEEELAAMPPAQRQAKEKEITERIRERLAATEKNRASKPGELEPSGLSDPKLTTPGRPLNEPTNLGSSGDFFSSFFAHLQAAEAKV